MLTIMWALFLLGALHHFRPTLVRADTLAGYKTEPKFAPEVFSIETSPSDRSLLGSGYLFLDPFVKEYGMGPQMYTMDGELVWYGNETATWRVQDFKVCDYLGESGSHLCWHEARERDGHDPYGRKVIFNSSYIQVGKNYTKAGNKAHPNTHEFRVLPGGESFLQAVYKPVKMNLRRYCGPKKGWVFDGCFMEISIRTGEPMFDWCFLDRFPVWHTRVYMDCRGQKNESSVRGAIGDGTHGRPWDFYHVNSIDKNSEGDYLLSSRYLDQITKIAGPGNAHGLEPGTVIWRLGGKESDFQMDFEFSKQHAVRYIATEETSTLLSLFSNHWDGHTRKTAHYSEGMIIRVYNGTNNMTAEVVQRFRHPHDEISQAQGSLQLLPNGNALIGWGNRPRVTEFSSTGEVLYHAEVERYSYRVKKFEWVGKPLWPPKLLAYTRKCSPSEVHAYVSWNGATEVKSWRFHATTSVHGPWLPIGTYPKDGFETAVKILTKSEASSKLLLPFPKYVSAEALDANNYVIGSVVSATFMPCDKTASKHDCNKKDCGQPIDYKYPPSHSCANSCGEPWIPGAGAALLILLAVEIIDFFYQRACLRYASASPKRHDGRGNEGAHLLKGYRD